MQPAVLPAAESTVLRFRKRDSRKCADAGDGGAAHHRFYLLWRLVRYQPHRRIPAAAAGIGFTVLVLLGAGLYRKAVHPGLWLMLGGCAILAGILWLTRKQAQNQRRRISLFLIGSSFFLRLFYVCYTPITRRQHDVGRFGDENNHAGYITYLLEHHRLPDFDPRDHWQFYHPPLHHAISAVWLWLSENVFGIGNEVAQESLQTLTLFYATAVIITAYRILRHFRLEGSALYFPLAVIAFHPSFILFPAASTTMCCPWRFCSGQYSGR